MRDSIPIANQHTDRSSRAYNQNLKDLGVRSVLVASKAGNHVRQDVLSTVAELVDDKSPLHLQAETAHERAFYHAFRQTSIALSVLDELLLSS